MAFDLIVRNATLRRKLDDRMWRSPPAASPRSSQRSRPGGADDRRARIPSRAAVRRLPLSSGRDAVARPSAPQRLRHAARGDRALGRAEASSHPRSGGGTRAPLLRSRRLAGPARHPQSCRRVRRPSGRGRGAARGEKKVKPYLDLQLVAFPQDGYFRSPTAALNLERALDLGVDVVGGIPHFERTMADGEASVRRCARSPRARADDRPALRRERRPDLAPCRDLGDETTGSVSAARATGSHLTSMHSMDNYYVSKLLPLIAESGMYAIANPLINHHAAGRHDTYPRRRG